MDTKTQHVGVSCSMEKSSYSLDSHVHQSSLELVSHIKTIHVKTNFNVHSKVFMELQRM